MRAAALPLLLAAMITSIAAAPPGQSLEVLADRYFDEYLFRFAPTYGTSAGFHQYDTRLEDFSPATVRARLAALQRFEREFARITPRRLTVGQQGDLALLRSHVSAQLLEWNEIRSYCHNPDFYPSSLSSSVFTLISRQFAPPEQRLQAVIAREKLMPALLQQARINLQNPPRILTEIALEQLPGIVSFFEKDVPGAFTAVTDAALRRELTSTNGQVIAALRDYGQFLKNDLLPRSQGNFRLGADLYRRKLLYDEMVDTPLDKLLAIGMADLRRNQQRLKEVAAQIDPGKPAREVLADLERDHPAPDKLLQAFRDSLGGLRDFITAKKLVTIPSSVPPILEETPPFLRALTFASMDTPGPYEKTAKEAYFNVTLPERTWSQQEVAEHMAAFNRGVIISTAIHEAYPGHYVQFLWVQQPMSKVRKLLGANSNAEGWAHYTEQMMLDEGYGNGDPQLRLGQLQDALLRNARYIAGIQMHTGQMTYEQAVAFFINEGYQTKANAVRESKRGTSDPTYLVYTLGKLQILQLREDYRRRMGARFNLGQFHDAFLRQGFPPVKIVRRALLGDESPVLRAEQ